MRETSTFGKKIKPSTTPSTAPIVTHMSKIADWFHHVASISEVAERHGYSVIVGNTQRDSVSEQRIVNLLVEQRVDGVLLASGTWDSSATELLPSAGIPVVRFLSDPQTLNTDFFGADDCEGTRITTNHLIGLGHVDIGFVTGPKSSISLQREQGFRDAMRGAELTINDQWIVDGAILREGAYNVGVQLLRKKAGPPQWCVPAI